LSRFDTCWRWLLNRNDSPWYDAVKLYRQDSSRQWGPVLETVADTLSARTSLTAPNAAAPLLAQESTEIQTTLLYKMGLEHVKKNNLLMLYRTSSEWPCLNRSTQMRCICWVWLL